MFVTKIDMLKILKIKISSKEIWHEKMALISFNHIKEIIPTDHKYIWCDAEYTVFQIRMAEGEVIFGLSTDLEKILIVE